MSKRRKRNCEGGEKALTVCAFDDLMMELGAESAGLVARGSRACTSRKLDRPAPSVRSPFAEALTLLSPSSAPCAALSVIWPNALGQQSDILIKAVQEYGAQELGLFAKSDLDRRSIVKGPKFLLLEVKPDQAGLNTQMQFAQGSKTWVGCGPARLVNHSCCPNVRWVPQAIQGMKLPGCRLMALKTLRDIQEGEQLFASYGVHYFGKGFERCKCPHHPERISTTIKPTAIINAIIKPIEKIVIDLTVDDDEPPARMIIDLTEDDDDPPPLIIDMTTYDSDESENDIFIIDPPKRENDVIDPPILPPVVYEKPAKFDIEEYYAATARRARLRR